MRQVLYNITCLNMFEGPSEPSSACPQNPEEGPGPRTCEVSGLEVVFQIL